MTFFVNAQIINLCYQTPRGQMLTVVCTAIIMIAQDQPVACSCDRVPRRLEDGCLIISPEKTEATGVLKNQDLPRFLSSLIITKLV